MTDRHGEHGLRDDPDIDSAWAFVIEHQGAQDRKAGDGSEPVPYTRHLRAVAKQVEDGGGSVEETIAALLHDVVEDTPVGSGRDVSLEDLDCEFGPRVGELIGGGHYRVASTRQDGKTTVVDLEHTCTFAPLRSR